MGRLKVPENELITVRDLIACGLIGNPRDGVKLLSKVRRFPLPVSWRCKCANFSCFQGKIQLKTPFHLEVSAASAKAIKAVENVGGTVTCSHFNRLALRALVKPFKFELFPQRARPAPKQMNYYLDRTKAGYLSPEVQVRNLKLFGAINSENKYEEEHKRFMENKRTARRRGLL